MSYFFKFNRPLSPHILIYKTSFTLLKSIFHRISGLILSVYYSCFLLNLKWVVLPNFLVQKLILSLKFNFLITSVLLFLLVYHFISGLMFLYFNYS
uniref:Succinate dehydrogenase subunit 3 n=1 Tax=Ceramothamnion japonicum TaxID=218448 RepID=A0A0E3DBB5_CERJP|nr:hypothetical protein Cjap.mt.23 [Ceramium japonicum]